jgi:iron complex transport system ATP-binding protein
MAGGYVNGNGDVMVSLKNVSFVRGKREIVAGIDWDIRRGEHWALMGANGSGKTTLLEMITGYRWPTGGHVHVLGKRYGATDLRELRKRIGYVGNGIEHRIYPHQRTRDVVLSGLDASLKWLGTPTPRELEAAETVLHHAGIEALAENTFETLSQGERKRTLIARALIHAPALLVLDEPCAGLDPRAREDFLADVAGLAGRTDGPSILFVTHHVEEIGPWINRVHLIRDGGTLVQGTPADTLTDAWMTKLLDTPCRLEQRHERYTLELV